MVLDDSLQQAIYSIIYLGIFYNITSIINYHTALLSPWFRFVGNNEKTQQNCKMLTLLEKK